MTTNLPTYKPAITPIDLFLKNHPPPATLPSNGSSFGTITINNNFLERMNTFGMAYFHILTVALYLAILYYSEAVYGVNAVYVNYFTTYELFSIFANYYLAMKYPAYFKPVDVCELPNDTWSFCSYCQQKQPPRCHHCPLCHKCISKRDHHCFFIGTCVGQRNQGYFAVYCFHVAIGLYIGFGILSAVLSNTYYELLSWDFYHYIPPVTLFDVLKGHADFSTFMLVVLMCGSLVTGIFTVFLFLWQCFLITCDLTTYDAQTAWNNNSMGIILSKLKPWYNIKAVFGVVPFLAFIFPLPIRNSKSVYSYRSNKSFL
ncbi:palmitoyltransferase ZDHHC16-like [Watersipora subatra]|uniref:palmitoyltransferase ZDHHC16-like n=1 Tax=Watersipora subatra TaxID=2589382 RepID=UPI00355BD65C